MVLQQTVKSKYQFKAAISKDSSEEELVRRVRGILNKITPETFDTLVRQLLDVGTDNERCLQDVIFVLFEKALKEPHFSGLYANVCKVLCEKAPNFEQPDLRGRTEGNTFRNLLLKNCQREFENRVQLCATLAESKKDGFTPEEEEEFMLARRKMLGNIKFIGELGKLNLVAEVILHMCIKQLLSRVRGAYPEDLECLCGLLTITGGILDHAKAKSHMDTYFERIAEIRAQPLPSRIRFMLEDVIEMRHNGWKPRMAKEGPKKLQDLRTDQSRPAGSGGGGVSIGSSVSTGYSNGNNGGSSRVTKSDYPRTPLPLTSTVSAPTPLTDIRIKPSSSLDANLDATVRSLASLGTPIDNGDISLRPNTGIRILGAQQLDSITKPRTPPTKRKQSPVEVTAEQALSRITNIVADLHVTNDLSLALDQFAEMRCAPHSSAIFERLVDLLYDSKEPMYSLNVSLFAGLVGERKLLEADKLVLAISACISRLPDIALDYPFAPVRLTRFIAELINAKLLSLSSLISSGESGVDAPFVAALLIELLKFSSTDQLVELCKAANLDILRIPPVATMSANEQHDFLNRFGLDFLHPQVKVKQSLKQLFAEHLVKSATAPAATRTLARTIKEQFSPSVTEVPEFSRTLFTALLEQITSITTLKSGSSHVSTKEERDEEKALLLATFRLIAPYASSEDRQIGLIYTAQAFCYANGFPKGLLLRVANELYDNDVVEQSAWMKWREEINDDEPGKGDALVALNEYLNWMETAEDDDDDDDN